MGFLGKLIGSVSGLRWPIGHYHSPIPSRSEVLKRQVQIFGGGERELPGIDLKEEEQLKLLKNLKTYYDDLPFPETADGGFRYYFKNGFYSYSDAVFLYSMIRHFKPKKIVEIGSGFSSAVMLDTNEHFFHDEIQCCFIDPNPRRLQSLLKKSDLRGSRLVKQAVQDVDKSVFLDLGENDILFIDSSHVSKTGSDVNFILFNILPDIKSGVLVHFHDIFYPFEYPRDWVLEGRAWNEIYILRAFLSCNSRFEIVLFNTFLEHCREEWFQINMPKCLINKGGSLWLRKL